MSGGDLQAKRILVVEDETIVLMLIEDMLADFGCIAVGPASRVDDALALLENQDLDGAVLDVNLGGETSSRIAEALARRGVPFIFITGYGESGLPADWRDRPVLAKPFTQQKLEQAARSLFAARID